MVMTVVHVLMDTLLMVVSVKLALIIVQTVTPVSQMINVTFACLTMNSTEKDFVDVRLEVLNRMVPVSQRANQDFILIA